MSFCQYIMSEYKFNLNVAKTDFLLSRLEHDIVADN